MEGGELVVKTLNYYIWETNIVTSFIQHGMNQWEGNRGAASQKPRHPSYLR